MQYILWQFCEFRMYSPLILYGRHVWCSLKKYNTYLQGTSILFSCTSIQDASCHNRQHCCLCGVTHKFTCVPIFKVVYAQIDITFLTDTHYSAIYFSVNIHDTVFFWNASVMDVSLLIHVVGLCLYLDIQLTVTIPSHQWMIKLQNENLLGNSVSSHHHVTCE